MNLSAAELDRIEHALRPLAASEACSADVKDAVRRFNERLDQERSRLARARAGDGPSDSMPQDLEVALQASAVMFAVERERIVRRFRFVPLLGPGA